MGSAGPLDRLGVRRGDGYGGAACGGGRMIAKHLLLMVRIGDPYEDAWKTDGGTTEMKFAHSQHS